MSKVIFNDKAESQPTQHAHALKDGMSECQVGILFHAPDASQGEFTYVNQPG